MKKLFLALSIMLMTTFAFSQDSKSSTGLGRGADGAGNPRMKEALKQKLISELKLTDAQADSVTVIQMESQRKMRELRMESSLSPEDKESKQTEIKAVRNKKLKAILTEEQIGKLQEMMENMRKNREHNEVKE